MEQSTMFNNQYFLLCQLLKEFGYDKLTEGYFVQYREDFTYDEDPSHPESHKKGEVRFYKSNFKNSFDWCPNGYAAPSLEDINNWLLKEKGFYVGIQVSGKNYFNYIIYTKDMDNEETEWNDVSHSVASWGNPDIAYITAFIEILNKYI